MFLKSNRVYNHRPVFSLVPKRYRYIDGTQGNINQS